MALTTLNGVKTFLNIALSNTTYDVLLETFRLSVEQSVINFCETDFLSHTITKELHDGTKSDVLVPKFYPILSVQKIVFGCDSAGNNGSELETDYYTFDKTGIFLLQGVMTPFSRQYVRIDYTAGYVAVPDDVKLCVYQSVKAEYQRHGRNTEDINSRAKGEENESYGSAWDKKTGLPSQIISKLQSYRSYEFPMIGMAQRNM